jgi:hypothetical protein
MGGAAVVEREERRVAERRGCSKLRTKEGRMEMKKGRLNVKTQNRKWKALEEQRIWLREYAAARGAVGISARFRG